MPLSTPIRYDIHRPAACYHYDITGPDSKENLYYCTVKPFTRKQPDLVLHAGLDKSAPPIALCHILQFSQSFKFGFGDPANEDDIEWEDLIRSNTSGSEHRWGMTLPSDVAPSSVEGEKSANVGRRLSLVWKKTTSVTVAGAREPLTRRRGHRGHRGWKLIEESDPKEILAVFTFDKSYGRRGLVQINAGHGDKFNVGVLMSVLTLYERTDER